MIRDSNFERLAWKKHLQPLLIVRRALYDTEPKIGQGGTETLCAEYKFARGIMTRQELLLAVLAASEGRPYTPVQIQKAIFLVTKNVPEIVSEGTSYGFAPYDYGPFDQLVYTDSEVLRLKGLVEITQFPGVSWKRYAASDKGVEAGKKLLDQMPAPTRKYIEKISLWVRSLKFEELVKSIYEAYPEMRVNSIFRG